MPSMTPRTRFGFHGSSRLWTSSPSTTRIGWPFSLWRRVANGFTSMAAVKVRRCRISPRPTAVYSFDLVCSKYMRASTSSAPRRRLVGKSRGSPAMVTSLYRLTSGPHSGNVFGGAPGDPAAGAGGAAGAGTAIWVVHCFLASARMIAWTTTCSPSGASCRVPAISTPSTKGRTTRSSNSGQVFAMSARVAVRWRFRAAR